MTVQNRHHTPPLIGPRWEEFSLAPVPAARGASFHASLRECEVNYVKPREAEPEKSVSIQPRAIEPQKSAPNSRRRSWPRLWPLTRARKTLPLKKQLQVVKSVTLETSVPNHSQPNHSQIVQPQRTGSRILAHIRSWLHSKYTMSSAKRLRVTEMVPLGEKRFLAVVSVEGREFLIGGGASGVSVVTQLQGALENAGAPGTDFALQGKSA
jgi:hypothetical protein